MAPDEMKRIGIGIALALTLAAVLYFGGRWQERGRAAGDRAEWAAQVEVSQAELARVQAQLALAEDRTRLLRARALLFETAVDLDRRNFGIANQNLRAAADQLEAVGESGAELDRQGLQELQRAIAGTDLNVATDLAVQRAQIMEFVARLDALLPAERNPPATSAHPTAAPAPDTAGGGA